MGKLETKAITYNKFQNAMTDSDVKVEEVSESDAKDVEVEKSEDNE